MCGCRLTLYIDEPLFAFHAFPTQSTLFTPPITDQSSPRTMSEQTKEGAGVLGGVTDTLGGAVGGVTSTVGNTVGNVGKGVGESRLLLCSRECLCLHYARRWTRLRRKGPRRHGFWRIQGCRRHHQRGRGLRQIWPRLNWREEAGCAESVGVVNAVWRDCERQGEKGEERV